MKLLDDPSLLLACGPAPAPGRVSLVGAGPGDPELLTVAAARRIGQARLVLHDQLVAPGILALLPPEAQCIDVGKRCGHHRMSQAGIIELMLQLARSGHTLLRLKGGDPYVFGRGGEEALALAAAGIPFEVIPGISAAQGAAAAAGIPLTHRDHATALTFVTGHGRADVPAALRLGDDPEAPEVDWAALARPHQTLVIYMGLSRLAQICRELVAHGLPAHTPAAVVERACQPGQRCIAATLADLPQRVAAEAVQAPALILVGEVVALRERLAAVPPLRQAWTQPVPA
ncbi:MAG: uroporphyrinogen-III C-methyltransferase [Burkholderiaceae bacterium]|nr:uroporphyrinogen-III C-methyltransferase [Burkholderiaceae bacterium]